MPCFTLKLRYADCVCISVCVCVCKCVHDNVLINRFKSLVFNFVFHYGIVLYILLLLLLLFFFFVEGGLG